jgi:hypothetical protein
VVTAFEFQLHPVPEALSGLIAFPFEMSKTVLQRYRELCLEASISEGSYERRHQPDYRNCKHCAFAIDSISLEAHGGAVARVANDATAFGHRDAMFNLGILAISDNHAMDTEQAAWAEMVGRRFFRTQLHAYTAVHTVPWVQHTVEAEFWLSCGSLALRRCILAIVASLFLLAAACGALVPECGRGTPFWTTMRSLHNADDRKTLSDRAALWNPGLREAVDFYW